MPRDCAHPPMALALLLGVLLGAARAAGATEWVDRYGGLSTPAYAGLSSFAGLDWARCLDERRSTFDVAILGLPWDGAVSYRPGARFGPQAIRAASRRQRKTSHSLHCECFHGDLLLPALTLAPTQTAARRTSRAFALSTATTCPSMPMTQPPPWIRWRWRMGRC